MTSNLNPHDETLGFDNVTNPRVDDLDDGANQDDDATLKVQRPVSLKHCRLILRCPLRLQSAQGFGTSVIMSC